MTEFCVPENSPASCGRKAVLAIAALVAAMTVLRLVYAALTDLRTDEAYYWTWAHENVLSFLDHPPMIAWFIRAGTAMFGDTTLGVRFAGIVAMLVSELLVADIVWRVTRNVCAAGLGVLLMEGAIYYGLLMAKVAPDTAAIPFSLAMLWALVRLAETSNARWWLAAGVFGGLALLSKVTVVFFVPAIVAFALVPDWRTRWLRSGWPWAAALIALAIVSPVLIWNAQNDWAGFKFQFVRAAADNPVNLGKVGEFIGLQLGLLNPILFFVLLSALAVMAWRGYRRGLPVAILLSTCTLVPLVYFFWKSLTLRIGDTWPMAIWPPAIAAAAINVAMMRTEQRPEWLVRSTERWASLAGVGGIVLVVLVFAHYTFGSWPLAAKIDPVAGEAGYHELAASVKAEMAKVGATYIATADYRTYAMMRWELRGGDIPVVQVNERSRFIGFRLPDAARIAGHVGVYVARAPDDKAVAWSHTDATLEPLVVVQRRWRGVEIAPYLISKVTGWTPDLLPARETPLYQWPSLVWNGAGDGRIALRRHPEEPLRRDGLEG